MPLPGPVQILSHRRRYGEIISVLSRHGAGPLFELFGLSSIVNFERRPFRRSSDGASLSQPQHLRIAFEELGTTFIKLGQILSTREDLLPPEYIAELSKLRDQVPSVETSAIVAVIEASFGQPLHKLFRNFDETPLAAASIGQVHSAELDDGTPVIVKVQKPGIVARVEEDLAILQQVAHFAQRRAPLAEAYDLVALVEEFSWTLRSELDYLREGRNADQFRKNFADSQTAVIPEVYWHRTSALVITEQRIDGLSISDLPALRSAGLDLPTLARNASRLILDEVFVFRLFHADPHPGNFAVMPDGRIVAYDFGMVGRIDDSTRDALLTLIAGAVQRDSDLVIDALGGLNVLKRGADRQGLRRDIQHLMDRYFGLTLQEYRFEVIVRDMLGVVRRHRLQLPSELSLLMKTLAMQEGIGQQLDPDFNPIEEVTPYIRRAMIEQHLPTSLIPKLLASGDEALRLALQAPRRLNRLLTRAEMGDLEFSMRMMGADNFIQQMQELANRIIIAVLLSASMISLGLLLSVYHPPWLVSLLGPLFGLGLIVTFIGGLWLGWRVLRSGRRPRL